MTSRTNRHSGGRHQRRAGEVTLYDLEQRRQLAVKRYLDGDPIEVICREMGCSKSWLYKWRDRYQADDPTWAQEVSRRPLTSPAKLSATLEQDILRLRQTALSTGAGPANAAAIRQALKATAIGPVPSLRTIYRVLRRHEKEVTHPPSVS
jgi:transposase-like protein